MDRQVEGMIFINTTLKKAMPGWNPTGLRLMTF